MSKIRIDADALTKGLSEIAKSVTGMQSAKSQLDKVVSDVTARWNGASGESYGALMALYSQQAADMADMMNSYLQYIEKVRDSFTKLDQESAQKIRSAF